MPLITVSSYKIKKLPPKQDPIYHLYQDKRLIFTSHNLDETLSHLFYKWRYEQRQQIAKMEAETEIKVTVTAR